MYVQKRLTMDNNRVSDVLVAVEPPSEIDNLRRENVLLRRLLSAWWKNANDPTYLIAGDILKDTMMVMDPAYVPGIGITDNLAIRNGELVTVKHVKADGTVDTKDMTYPTREVKCSQCKHQRLERARYTLIPMCAHGKYLECCIMREDDALCGKEARFYEPIEHRKGNL